MKPSHRQPLVRALRILAGTGIVLAYLAACGLFVVSHSPELWVWDLEEILAAGELTVITRNNAHCYYHYRGQPMGFEYDLTEAFADSLGVDLDVRIADRWAGMIPSVIEARGRAIIAASLTRTRTRSRRVAFSDSYLTIHQHLVGHRRQRAIRRVADLEGREVHIRRGTSYEDRLRALQRQGIGVKIVLHDDVPTEELIRRVAERKIALTVADSHIAKLNRRYFPDIRVGIPLGPAQQLAWAAHRHSPKLLQRINAFLAESRRNGLLTRLHDKYFNALEEFDYVDLRAFHRRIETRLPRYKPLIQAAADRHGFDWRMLAAQIYQESHWDLKAQSHAGAYGLMQLTENTARSLAVKNILDPAENIAAGTRHLKNLYDFFDQARGRHRLFLALAAYNVGQGHLLDARNLARARGLDPNRWESLQQTLPLLSYRKYYQNSIYGYARGNQPVEYIRQILIYYDILKRRGIEYRVAQADRDSAGLVTRRKAGMGS